jgi:hypothetical protein
MSYVKRHQGVRSAGDVRLEPGSHRSPDDGVCIVELASIIGGEPFSDRPDCVCPVIAAFLRGWNDRAGYAARQRLRPYARRVVGTGGYRRISRIRRDLCLRWAGADLDRGPVGRSAVRLRLRLRIAWSVGLWPALRLKQGAGAYAARACFTGDDAEAAFELLDRMLEVGATPRPIAPGNGNGNGNGRADEAELFIRATIVARQRAARSRGARGSGSRPAAAADRPGDRPVARPPSGS